MLPGLRFFYLTRPCLRPDPALRSAHNMLDRLRQGLVRPPSGKSLIGSATFTASRMTGTGSDGLTFAVNRP